HRREPSSVRPDQESGQPLDRSRRHPTTSAARRPGFYGRGRLRRSRLCSTMARMTTQADLAATPVEQRILAAPHLGRHAEVRKGHATAAPIVLVHGLASNLRLWDGVAERLNAEGHTVVAVDQRGHGRSDAPDSGYEIGTAVADLLALIQALGLERPLVAG